MLLEQKDSRKDSRSKSEFLMFCVSSWDPAQRRCKVSSPPREIRNALETRTRARSTGLPHAVAFTETPCESLLKSFASDEQGRFEQHEA